MTQGRVKTAFNTLYNRVGMLYNIKIMLYNMTQGQVEKRVI